MLESLGNFFIDNKVQVIVIVFFFLIVGIEQYDRLIFSLFMEISLGQVCIMMCVLIYKLVSNRGEFCFYQVNKCLY